MEKHFFAQWFLIVLLCFRSAYSSSIEVSSWDELNQAISGGSEFANLPNTSTTIQFLGYHFSNANFFARHQILKGANDIWRYYLYVIP